MSCSACSGDCGRWLDRRAVSTNTLRARAGVGGRRAAGGDAEGAARACADRAAGRTRQPAASGALRPASVRDGNSGGGSPPRSACPAGQPPAAVASSLGQVLADQDGVQGVRDLLPCRSSRASSGPSSSSHLMSMEPTGYETWSCGPGAGCAGGGRHTRARGRRRQARGPHRWALLATCLHQTHLHAELERRLLGVPLQVLRNGIGAGEGIRHWVRV